MSHRPRDSASRTCSGERNTRCAMGEPGGSARHESRRSSGPAWPPARALWVLGGAALANGLAVYLYASSVANPAVPAGPFIVVVSVLQVAAIPFLVWVMPGGQAPTVRQAVGFAFAAVAVYLLAKS